jgi:hypothetical protein
MVSGDSARPTQGVPMTVLVASRPTFSRPDTAVVCYWLATAVFCLQMGFTAYAQLNLPVVAGMFGHLGFPDYFRVELSWAKVLGIALLLAPVPARLKEWAHAGFVITLVSALVAHLSMGDGPAVWSWAAVTLGLWAVMYALWRKVQHE